MGEDNKRNLLIKRGECKEELLTSCSLALVIDEETRLQTIKAQEGVTLIPNIMQMKLQRYTRKREEFLLLNLIEKQLFTLPSYRA